MTLSPERLDRLQQQWWYTMQSAGVPAEVAYAAFDDLVRRYGEPHRHYHTLEHIAEMLRITQRLTPAGVDPFPISLAVWFHDAIYDTHSKTNEFDSGQYAAGVLNGLGLPENLIGEVVALIVSTDHRAAPDAGSPIEFQILHDADLAILGAAEPRYDRYAADVRKEYAWVPEDPFRGGRTTVLKQFLDRPAIYLTPRMRDEGETPARANLQREITSLVGSL